MTADIKKTLSKWFETICTPNVIAIRQNRSGSPTAHPPNGVSPVQSWRRDASDAAQVCLPVVQSAVGAVPVVGSPMKVVIASLLSILQSIDTMNANKSDLEQLTSRLHQLFHFIARAQVPQDSEEELRREMLKTRLEGVSRKLSELKQRWRFMLASSSVTREITGCNTDISNFLLEYSVLSQVHNQESSAVLKRQQDQVLAKLDLIIDVPNLLQAQISGCITLVDAAGHEHLIPLKFCLSYQQLTMALRVLFQRDFSGARVQQRYLEAGLFDLCIHDGRVIQVMGVADGWPIIEADTKVVFRVIFEEPERTFEEYKCHLCGSVNYVEFRGQCAMECQACKGWFQITIGFSINGSFAGGRAAPGVITIDTETRHCIRNFRVHKTGHNYFPGVEKIAHNRQTLNNYLQATYIGDTRRRLTWETYHEGPEDRPTWCAIAYLGGIERGRGQGLSRGAAMEVAAGRVLDSGSIDFPPRRHWTIES